MPQVNLRTSTERLAAIDRAAAIRGVSRTEFVLRSSEAAAIEIFNERPVIALDDGAWGGSAPTRSRRPARSVPARSSCRPSTKGRRHSTSGSATVRSPSASRS